MDACEISRIEVCVISRNLLYASANFGFGRNLILRCKVFFIADPADFERGIVVEGDNH